MEKKLKKFIALTIPDYNWDGIDWIEDLAFCKKNNLNFILVTAKSIEDAKNIYFNKYFFPRLFKYRFSDACDDVCFLCESYDENQLIQMYGEKDGKILWQITYDFDNNFPDEDRKPIYDKRIELISEKNIIKLCRSRYELSIGVSEIINELEE